MKRLKNTNSLLQLNIELIEILVQIMTKIEIILINYFMYKLLSLLIFE